MIVMDDITKSYGALQVLRGVSLEIEPGRVTSIVGKSGAGKTTLLQILGTLDRPDSGRVMYDGDDVASMRDSRLSRFRCQNIGFVFQNHRLLPEFTIQENVAMAALINGEKRRSAMDRARQLLEDLGLGERLNHRPAELSGGECQRAAVARALINSPRVILADEPTGSLDSVNRRALQDLFFNLRDKLGMTFVIVTHDESLADRSDVIVHLSDGRVTDIRRAVDEPEVPAGLSEENEQPQQLTKEYEETDYSDIDTDDERRDAPDVVL